MDPLLALTEHRPVPMPAGPWVMEQVWHDLLFMHWALAPEALRPLVPAQLELDVREGKAWLAVTPFWMSGVRPRGLPALPWLSKFPELNVRTYVTYGGQPGVYFFSLDAARLLAVWAARVGYRLPYFHAEMAVRGTERIEYRCRRARLRVEGEFEATYWPTGPASPPRAGTLEHFFTERYCLYTTAGERVYRAYIHHAPWPLQAAQAEIRKNTVPQADGVTLPDTPPHLLFARELRVLIWLPERA